MELIDIISFLITVAVAAVVAAYVAKRVARSEANTLPQTAVPPRAQRTSTGFELDEAGETAESLGGTTPPQSAAQRRHHPAAPSTAPAQSRPAQSTPATVDRLPAKPRHYEPTPVERSVTVGLPATEQPQSWPPPAGLSRVAGSSSGTAVAGDDSRGAVQRGPADSAPDDNEVVFKAPRVRPAGQRRTPGDLRFAADEPHRTISAVDTSIECKQEREGLWLVRANTGPDDFVWLVDDDGRSLPVKTGEYPVTTAAHTIRIQHRSGEDTIDLAPHVTLADTPTRRVDLRSLHDSTIDQSGVVGALDDRAAVIVALPKGSHSAAAVADAEQIARVITSVVSTRDAGRSAAKALASALVGLGHTDATVVVAHALDDAHVVSAHGNVTAAGDGLRQVLRDGITSWQAHGPIDLELADGLRYRIRS